MPLPLPLPQGLVKNLLDVADNLERAAGSVPLEEVGGAEGGDDSGVDRERALKLLRSLREGVLITDAVLMKVRGGGWVGICVGAKAGRVEEMENRGKGAMFLAAAFRERCPCRRPAAAAGAGP